MRFVSTTVNMTHSDDIRFFVKMTHSDDIRFFDCIRLRKQMIFRLFDGKNTHPGELFRFYGCKNDAHT